MVKHNLLRALLELSSLHLQAAPGCGTQKLYWGSGKENVLHGYRIRGEAIALGRGWASFRALNWGQA